MAFALAADILPCVAGIKGPHVVFRAVYFVRGSLWPKNGTLPLAGMTIALPGRPVPFRAVNVVHECRPGPFGGPVLHNNNKCVSTGTSTTVLQY